MKSEKRGAVDAAEAHDSRIVVAAVSRGVTSRPEVRDRSRVECARETQSCDEACALARSVLGADAMHSFRSLLASSSVVVFLLVACKGSTDEDANDACGSYIQALIDAEARCSPTGLDSSREQLRSRLIQSCNEALAVPGAAPDLASQLQACAAKQSTAVCGSDTDCTLKGGTLADGAACFDDYQCAGGDCRKTSSDASCGTCAKAAPVGGDCSNAECVEGSTCVHSTGKATCVAVKIGQAGEACFGSDGTVVRCADGLRCAFGADEAKCAAPAAAGAACKSQYDCQETLRCIAGKCAAPVAAGGDCTALECDKGFGCSVDHKCVAITQVGIGQDCDIVRRCSEGECVGLSAMGSTDGEVSIKPGRCVAYLAEGAACSTDSSKDSARCAPPAKCVAGKCTTQSPSACK